MLSILKLPSYFSRPLFIDSYLFPVIISLLVITVSIYQIVNRNRNIHWFTMVDQTKNGLNTKDTLNQSFNRWRYAILIPYKDRGDQLDKLLATLPGYMLWYGLNFTIFVVEQNGTGPFNRGHLLNVAFDHIIRNSRSYPGYDCFIFHDVDLLPNGPFLDLIPHPKDHPYHCSRDSPLHLSTAIDEMRFNLLYPHLMGGVSSFTKDQFIKVNGFSNMYNGWGAEDDDLANRVQDAGFTIVHMPENVGVFKMARHKKCHKSSRRLTLLATWRRWRSEGLNSLRSLTPASVNGAFDNKKYYTNTNGNVTDHITSTKIYSLTSSTLDGYIRLLVSS